TIEMRRGFTFLLSHPADAARTCSAAGPLRPESPTAASAPARAAAAAKIACALLFVASGAAAQPAAPPGAAAWQTSCPAASAPCIAYAQNGGETRVGTAAVRLSVGNRSPSEPVVVV